MKLRAIILLLSLWSLCASAQVTNRYAFPAFAGLRLREVNIVNGTNDSGNLSTYGVPANYYNQDYFWNTGTLATNSYCWVTNQIAAAALGGANCIRMIWDGSAFVGMSDANHHGAATWLGTNSMSQLTNEIGNVASTCQKYGLLFYATCSESRPLSASVSATNMIFNYVSNFCYEAVQYPNVFAVDVIQELDGTSSTNSWGGTNGVLATNVNLWISAAHAGMDAFGRRVPCTCSLNGAGSATDLNINSRPQAATNATCCDFLDVHIYYNFATADLYQAVTNKWNLPVVVGESGIPQNGTQGSGPDNESTHPYSSELLTHMHYLMEQASEMPYFQLYGHWAIAPNVLTNEEDFGLYSGAINGSGQLFTLREWQRNFLAVPTNIQPPNYSWSIVSTGANTTASSYTGPDYYGVQSAMLDATLNGSSSYTPIWQRLNNCVEAVGNSGSINIPDGKGVLFFTAFPYSTKGQHIQFTIPPSAYPLYLSEYVNWECTFRNQANGDCYLLSLTSDNAKTFDNLVQIYAYTNATKFPIFSQYYTNLTYFNTNQTWLWSATISSNSSPSTITLMISNATTGTVMSPIATVNDSSGTLQGPGGLALAGYLGSPLMSNVQASVTFDTTPTISTPPAGTPTGNSVALTWNAAAGGSGTVNYTPQWVVTEGTTNYPSVNTWTAGTQTTSTSETVTVPASTNLFLRVMSVDSTGATNYSSWSEIQSGAALGGRKPIFFRFR